MQLEGGITHTVEPYWRFFLDDILALTKSFMLLKFHNLDYDLRWSSSASSLKTALSSNIFK